MNDFDELNDSFMVKIPGFKRDKKFFTSPKKMVPTTKEDYLKLQYGESYVTKRGKIDWKQKPIDRFLDWWAVILEEWILYPFYLVIKIVGKILRKIFYTKSNFQDNGIMGPGYESWHEEHFSWGKLSFILFVAFIIIYFIWLR